MLRRYGQYEVISVLSDINLQGYFKYYEEIITCKDCKHRKKVKDDYCEYTNMLMDDDEFCSSGERIE